MGSTGSLTGFGGPHRRLGMLEGAPISRVAVAGVQWEWGRAPRIALDSSFQGDFPCNCLF